MPFPTNFNKKLFPKPEIGFPSMKIIVIPLNTVIVIRVAMNGCNLPFVTRSPLITPQPTPIANANNIARPTGTPDLIK